MRKPSWKTTLRFKALQAFRRAEILASPVLGWLALLVILPIAWVLGCVLAVLAVTFYLWTVFYSAVRQELRPLTPNT